MRYLCPEAASGDAVGGHEEEVLPGHQGHSNDEHVGGLLGNHLVLHPLSLLLQLLNLLPLLLLLLLPLLLGFGQGDSEGSGGEGVLLLLLLVLLGVGDLLLLLLLVVGEVEGEVEGEVRGSDFVVKRGVVEGEGGGGVDELRVRGQGHEGST